MSNCNPNKCLDPEMTIKSIDDILFDIGLTPTSTREEQRKRRLFYDSRTVFIVLLLYSIVKALCLLVDQHNPLAKYLCDFSPLVGLTYHWNSSTLVFALSTLWLQIHYYTNYRCGIEPTFLRVFKMLSGTVSPISVGLTNQKDINSLVRISKFLFLFLSALRKMCPFITFSYPLTPYILKATLLDTILFGLPGTFTFMVAGQHMTSILSAKFIHFTILCQYLKLKLRNLNETALGMNGKISISRIQNILHSLDALYREIDEYNTSYWSNFLLNIWLAFGVPTTIWVNAFLLVPVSILIKINLFFMSTGACILFWLGLSGAASVNYEASKSYKIINKLASRVSKCKVRHGYRLKVINPNKKLFNINYGLILPDSGHYRENCIEESWIFMLGSFRRQLLSYL